MAMLSIAPDCGEIVVWTGIEVWPLRPPLYRARGTSIGTLNENTLFAPLPFTANQSPIFLPSLHYKPEPYLNLFYSHVLPSLQVTLFLCYEPHRTPSPTGIIPASAVATAKASN
ncbi:hypothetical protein L195_g005919 [Trifolium pratense]|uniref:Uncharacterized protein n=1 Tax=Trifolium pratense TaxID=57577 RepID=A0A2K3P279_TRIPR|nr:hypothetical protein L195_g005919 [Trifolium pratense]